MIVWPSTPEVVNAICNVASGEFVANYMEQRGAQKVSLLKIGVRIVWQDPVARARLIDLLFENSKNIG